MLLLDGCNWWNWVSRWIGSLDVFCWLWSHLVVVLSPFFRLAFYFYFVGCKSTFLPTFRLIVINKFVRCLLVIFVIFFDLSAIFGIIIWCRIVIIFPWSIIIETRVNWWARDWCFIRWNTSLFNSRFVIVNLLDGSWWCLHRFYCLLFLWFIRQLNFLTAENCYLSIQNGSHIHSGIHLLQCFHMLF
jgi:hypothetical protein